MAVEELQPLVHRVSNASARLGVSRTTLYELIQKGQLRTIRIGGRVVVPESELQRVVAEAMAVAA